MKGASKLEKRAADQDIEDKAFIWMQAISSAITRSWGIELNWSEKAGLRNYLRCFYEAVKEGREISPVESSYHFFMRDYFGMDMRELGDCEAFILNLGKKEHVRYGMQLLGDERSKQYCRDNVNMWREERGIPERR